MIEQVLLAILACVGLSMFGAAAGRTAAGRLIVYGGTVVVSAVVLRTGVLAIAAPVATLTLPIGLPGIGGAFRLDALAAFFLVLIGLGGAGAGLFAMGDARHEQAPQRVLPFYPVFLASMILVVIADDAYVFLFAWELMSLASWALVMTHHQHHGTIEAGYIYLLMAVFSGLVLMLALGLLAGVDGGFSFAAMRVAHPAPWAAGLVFVLALIGAGSKAGLVPVHVWLPLAHPAAPSHVSALMSGVMTKIALYGFIRIVFDLLGVPPWWAALIVLLLGGVSAVLGVLHALLERDLKRLLAYSTVDNIGIIFVGVGLAMAFRANAYLEGAALALTAALFHALNHTAFKSLLFFGAGAVLSGSGERDIEHLGGLIHRMPRTAVAVLVGCMAIAALPPLNGFASEWLIFQAMLLRPELPQWGLKLMIPVDAALLALAAALAAACFVRAFGMTFLGRPRSTAAEQAREPSVFSVAAMMLFAALCFLAGVMPGALIDFAAPAVQAMTGGRLPPQLAASWVTVVPVAASRSSYSGILMAVFIGVSTWLSALAIHRFASHALRRAPFWDCGFPDAGPMIQYSATSFAQPIRRIFGSVMFRARESVDIPQPGDMRAASIVRELHDPIWDGIYAPLARVVSAAADRLNPLQFLTVRRYLVFVFVALVALLLALTLWQ